MSNYTKGANGERKFIKMLLAGYNGWPPALWAARTAGSHSKVDIAADWGDMTRRFQLKRGTGKVDESEISYLRTLVSPFRECYSVEWPDYCTPTLRRVR